MDIKEIALKICRGMNPYSDLHESEFIYFANKLIESYKAELLKEAGEPVAEVIRKFSYKGDFETAVVRWEGEIPHHGVDLYTSDQVAAAIAKATKPLEEEIERLKSEQTELIDRFQNENCGRVHMGEPVISQSIKETVRQWLDIRANENVEIDIDELVKIAQGNLQEEAAQYKDELAMVLRCSADLRSQLAAAQEEIDQLRQRVQELEKQRDELLADLAEVKRSAEFNFEQYQDVGRLLHEECEKTEKLLSALEKCRKELSAWMRDHGDDIATQEAVADARAAIASVKGEQ